MANNLVYRPIGIARSPFVRQAGTPVQPTYAATVKGMLEIEEEYAPALKDLDGFERIWVLYHFNRAGPYQAMVVPYHDDTPHGLFATRAPGRPNPIGISVVKLLSVKGTCLEVEGLDLLDGTPLLDLKPYIPEFDAFSPSRTGWLANGRRRTTADSRFEDES